MTSTILFVPGWQAWSTLAAMAGVLGAFVLHRALYTRLREEIPELSARASAMFGYLQLAYWMHRPKAGPRFLDMVVLLDLFLFPAAFYLLYWSVNRN